MTRNRDILSDVKRLPNALVIDDDTQVLAFVANVLRSDGWRVSEAGTAEEAFGIVHEQPWTLVFWDVVLADSTVMKFSGVFPTNRRTLALY